MSLLKSIVLLPSVLVQDDLQHGLRVEPNRFQEYSFWVSLVSWPLHFIVVQLLLLLLEELLLFRRS